MMILSVVATMIVSVGATASAASDTPNSILVSDGTDAAEGFYNADKPGWSMTNNGHEDNTYKVVEIVTGKVTEKAVGDTITGPATFPIFGYRFHYWMDGTLDISGMKYVEFDLYLSDAEAYKGQTMIVELASGGIDDDEISFEGNYPLKDGWNHIRLDIATNFTGKNGNFDKTAWKFLRLHFSNQEATATVAEGEEFIIAIDNLEFNNGLTNEGGEVAPHSVTLSDCNATVDGWGWSGDTSLMCDNSAENTGSVSKVFLPGQKIPFAAINNYYDLDAIGGDTPTYYDTSAATKFKFEFYTSSADQLMDIPFELELTSGGNCDAEEIAWSQTKLTDLIEGGLKDGWNTVVLDILPKMEQDKRGYRPDHWNWFRMFSMQDFGTTDGLTVAIDNVRFEDDNGDVVLFVSDCNPDMKGWGGTVGALNVPKVIGQDEETLEDILEMKATMGKVYTSNIAAPGGLQILYKNSDNNGLNITGMKFIEFDLYVSDALALPESRNIYIELTSGGDTDKQEISYQLYTSDNESMGLKEGWNHVVIPLSLFTDKTGGEFQWTYLNCMRIYNQNEIKVDGEFTIAIDNVSFWDGKDDLKTSARGDVLQARETISFMPNTEDEKAYMYGEWKYEASKLTDKNSPHYRFSNNEGVGIYKFDIENFETAKKAIFSAKIGGQLLLSVSTDGENWEEVYRFEDERAAAGKPNNLEKAVRAFELTKYIVDEEGYLLGESIYVKLEDSYGNVAGGWGAQIHFDAPVTLDVVYDIPEFETTDNYSFTIGTGAEENYMIEAGSINAEKTVRFADANNQIVYKFDLDRTTNFESLSFAAAIQGQYVLSASTDGQNWKEVLRWDGEEGGANGPTSATYKVLDLSSAIELVGTIETVYIRMTDADTSNGHGGAFVNTHPVTLSAGYFNADAIKHEKTSFKILSEDEKAYLHEQKANDLADSRFADKTAYWTYKYELSEDLEGVRSITWTATINAQYHIQASVDGSNWIDLGKSTETADKQLRSFDASALITDALEAGTLYIKIGDADTSDGNGGRVWVDTPITLDIAYIPLTDAQKDALEMMEDVYTKPLDGCNALWSAKEYTVDFENATAGSGCLSVDLKNGIISQKNFDSDVNADGMDTLEFELYLNDLAILDEVTFGDGDSIEICSGGSCDQGEKNYSIKKIFENLKTSGKAQVGWNHIAIELSDMGSTEGSYGPFDPAKVNFMRIFWVAASMPADSAERFTIKFDNFRLTAAGKIAADKLAKEKAEFDSKYADLVTAIKALDAYKSASKITAENYEAAKAEIQGVRTQFDALSENDQRIADEAGYLNYLTKAEKSLAGYEEDLAEAAEALEKNKDLVDKINGLTTSITNDNYEAQKKAAEEARAAYDKLTRTVKGYFEDAGLTEKLEAAEAAIEAFDPTKPPVTTECEHADADADGKCDKCGKDMGSTPPPSTECTEHADADGDKKCDKCGADMGGCKSALTIGAVAMMVLAGAWVTIAARKKD